MRSGRSGAVSRGPRSARMARATTSTPASSQNSPPAPATAITTPAIAGPTARATLTDTFVIATAGATSRRGTRSGTVAEKAGRNIARPAPRAAVRTSTMAGVTTSATVRVASTLIDTAIARHAATSSRRRSSTSATAPAKSDSTTPGTLIAVWISATSAADPDSRVITSTAPTVCAQMTSCAPRKANQATRNLASRSGASAETGGGAAVDGAVSGLASVAPLVDDADALIVLRVPHPAAHHGAEAQLADRDASAPRRAFLTVGRCARMEGSVVGELRYRRLLVAIDGSPSAELALAAAVTAARRDRASVTVIAVARDALAEAARWPAGPVVTAPVSQEEADADAERLVRDAVARIPEEIPVTRLVRRGRAGPEIVAEAGSGKYDAILLGARGVGRIGALIGSVSQYVLHHAETAVFVAHAPRGG